MSGRGHGIEHLSRSAAGLTFLLSATVLICYDVSLWDKLSRYSMAFMACFRHDFCLRYHVNLRRKFMKKKHKTENSGNCNPNDRILNKTFKNGVGGLLSKGGVYGKRLVARGEDPIVPAALRLRRSKKSALEALSARREWSSAVYLDQLLDGNAEIIDEYVAYLQTCE